jgi:hypothetical protein
MGMHTFFAAICIKILETLSLMVFVRTNTTDMEMVGADLQRAIVEM